MPTYSLTGAMSVIPTMKVAIRMCGMTRSGITSSLPITGTLTSPIPTAVYLPLAGGGAAGEVGDPDQREKHVEHYHNDHQEGYHHHEGPPRRAVRRLLVQPGNREQQDDKQERYYHIPEGYENGTGEVHQPLIQEEEEPLGTRYVDRRADVHRLRQRGGHRVREGDYDRQKNRRDGEVRHYLPGKETLGLVVVVEDVLLGYFLSLFYRLSRTVPYLHHPLLLSRTFSAAIFLRDPEGLLHLAALP